MKFSFFHEPELEFGSGGTHVDIRYGITQHGPLDIDETTAPSKLRVGLIGTDETIAAIRHGGSNPPPATMNATAELQWRSPVLSFSVPRKPPQIPNTPSLTRLPTALSNRLLATLPCRGNGNMANLGWWISDWNITRRQHDVQIGRASGSGPKRDRAQKDRLGFRVGYFDEQVRGRRNLGRFVLRRRIRSGVVQQEVSAGVGVSESVLLLIRLRGVHQEHGEVGHRLKLCIEDAALERPAIR
jgi:hypothetical protein